jgi:hypothetical protein
MWAQPGPPENAEKFAGDPQYHAPAREKREETAMRIVLGSLLLMLAMACGDSADESSSAEPVEPVANLATEPAGALDAEGDESPGAPLDASKAKAFVTYQEQLIPFLKELQKVSAKDGQLDVAVQGASDLAGRFGENVEELDSARRAAGLSDADVSALMEIEAGVLSRAAGAGITVQIDELEKSLPTLAPALRPDAQRSLDEMKAMRDGFLNLTELRARYGDAIVDAMIELQPELSRQLEGLSKVD